MIIDCISDLHGHYPKLEGGDLLIIAGDLTCNDTISDWKKFYDWMDTLNYSRRVYIGGNHDNFLVKALNSSEADRLGLDRGDPRDDYLCDSGTEFEGLKIWGSPWTLKFDGMNPNCMAFTCDTEEELAEKWALIPDDIDILVTHGPSRGSLDTSVDGVRCGSVSLLRWIADQVDTLKIHVCGHIHEGYGIRDHRKIQLELNGKLAPVFINCSHVNDRYEPVNRPIRVIL